MSLSTPHEHRTAAAWSSTATSARHLGVLLLRLGMAGMLWRFHVSHKLQHFSAELHGFPDPLGVGHAASLVLALSTEGLCSLSVALGFATRLACLPIVFTMFMVLLLSARGLDGGDVQAAWLYALPYATLILTGPGRFSLDARFARHYVRALERVSSRKRLHARTEVG